MWVYIHREARFSAIEPCIPAGLVMLHDATYLTSDLQWDGQGVSLYIHAQ